MTGAFWCELGGHGVRPYGHRPAPLFWAISTEFPGPRFQAETAWVWPLRVGYFAPLRMTGSWGVGWADTGSAPTIVTPSTFLCAGFVSDLADSPSDARPVREGLLFVAAAGGVVSCSILPGEGLNPI